MKAKLLTKKNTKLSVACQELINYENQGCVFHGSNNPDIKKLEPRPATDMDVSDRFNNDNAIFAAVSPISSVLFACMSWDIIPKNIRKGSWSVGPSKNDDKIIARMHNKWKPYLDKSIGYVYVLRGDSFIENDGWQVKSKIAVIPVKKVKVLFQDFEMLGGILIWE